jgi:hypothetical protein
MNPLVPADASNDSCSSSVTMPSLESRAPILGFLPSLVACYTLIKLAPAAANRAPLSSTSSLRSHRHSIAMAPSRPPSRRANSRGPSVEMSDDATVLTSSICVPCVRRLCNEPTKQAHVAGRTHAANLSTRCEVQGTRSSKIACNACSTSSERCDRVNFPLTSSLSFWLIRIVPSCP